MTHREIPRTLGSGELPTIPTDPLGSVQAGAQPGATVFDFSSTLTDLTHTLAVGAWPTRGLAVRAAVAACDPAQHAALLRCADGHYIRAARLWLQIASYVESHDDELLAALRMSARCARIGGNADFFRNCMARLAAAERQCGIAGSAPTAAAS
jgi:hypothetical protein